MGNRRFAQISTSDEDEEIPQQRQQSSEENQLKQQKKRKQMKLPKEEEEEAEEEEEEEDEEEEDEEESKRKRRKNNKKKKKGEKEKKQDEEEEEPVLEPIGEPIRVSGKGRGRKSHYEAFEYDGNRYDLEDPVLLVPEAKYQKPYVAIIKDITRYKSGSMMVTGQWFYRPEEAELKGGGHWKSHDTRELFYSFHRDDVPAESVMHKCVVHFVPLHKQLPNRKQYPGFIVQRVYDTVERKLWKLTDKDYEDNKQHEIDLLVQKTMKRLVDLPDIVPEDNTADQEDQLKAKRSLRKKNITPLDVSREEDSTTRTDQHLKSETPGSCPSTVSEYSTILTNFNVLTGDNFRDKWLEKLLQGVQYVCKSPDNTNKDGKGEVGEGTNHGNNSKSSEIANGSQAKTLKSGKSFLWPDAAVTAVAALEKASHESLSLDFQKYNQKMRQLAFNLKNSVLLAQRLLGGELEPSKILNMSPIELKEGLTSEEMATKEPDESERMQMTDARCSRCSEFKVGVRDIIQAGHGDRYQLECIACGHSWYASRDEASTLTIDAPSSKNVGTAPWATAKFEDVEKSLVSPRESSAKTAANDVLKKTSEAYMPVLDAQRSFSKTKKDDNPEASTKNTDQTAYLSMGLEMKLDFGKNSAVDLSPKTVLPSHQHCSYVGKRNTKGRPRRKDDLLSLKEDFREISFHRYRSTSCKSIPSRSFGQEGKIEVKRGSIYQSSKEVRKIKKLSTIEGRRKIKMLPSSGASISSRIVDSLCNSDKESPQRRSQAMSSNSNSIPSPVSKPCIVPSSSDGFIEICLYPGNRGKNSVESVGSGSMDLSLGSKPVAGPLNNGNELLEREAVHTFHKSLSTKVEMRHSPSPSESDCSSKASSKSRFSPIRKMFDPFIKSKSLRSPLSYALEPGEVKIKGMKNKRVNRTYCKSLLDDFSNNARDPEYKSTLGERDNHQSFFACSPVHLHGFLKLETKHGIPFFEFSLKCPQDVFVAKSWKVNDACNWVYTFHCVDSGKKSSASGWGLFDGDKDSSMVGQMQVSCYLCSELKDGVFDNSMVTEFVLYDIAHARLNVAAQENSSCTLDAVKSSKDSNPGLDRQTLKLDDVTHTSSVKLKQDHATYDGQFNSSNPHPWPTANLHPNLEIAAIIMQVPFEKRESLKYKRGDKGSDKAPKNLLSLSIVEQRKEDLPERRSPEKVKVVIPAGNHGLPSAESCGPSSLLDRWRLGGGCDCGGWDMACPLVVLGNPHFQFADNQPLVENQGPLELFVQGGKEQTPALTMSVVEEGLYAVDFHAQLSTLQAFSICIAILHSTETSSAGQMQERDKQLPHCNSLKVLIEDEVKFLIEAVTAEEKRNVTKRVKEIPASFVLNPPFSPMSRA